MASKPSHDKLIHCDACGEDYSATYRRCPFCGERNDPRRAVRDSAPPRDEDGQDDGYVFDGQDAFDDEADEEYYTPRPKAGKRLAPKQGGMELPPVNWPRLITFLCSLVIIVAALVIVFTVIYPQLHGSKDPKPDASQSQPPASQDPSSHPSSVVDLPTPPVEPTADLPPVDTTPVQPVLTGIALDKTDMTLWVGDSWQLKTTFTPADWSGAVSWTSSNPEWVTVSDTGLVTNVNASGKYHNAYITATVGDVSAQCVVRVQSRKQNDPPAQSPAPAASDPPATATTTPPPSGGSGPVVGRPGTIVNAELGLRVRSGPGTSYEILASLTNGTSVNVLAAADGGWYQISFAGSGGSTMTGYVLGEYVSAN